jgi:hypothetical protein
VTEAKTQDNDILELNELWVTWYGLCGYSLVTFAFESKDDAANFFRDAQLAMIVEAL